MKRVRAMWFCYMRKVNSPNWTIIGIGTEEYARAQAEYHRLIMKEYIVVVVQGAL